MESRRKWKAKKKFFFVCVAALICDGGSENLHKQYSVTNLYVCYTTHFDVIKCAQSGSRAKSRVNTEQKNICCGRNTQQKRELKVKTKQNSNNNSSEVEKKTTLRCYCWIWVAIGGTFDPIHLLQFTSWYPDGSSILYARHACCNSFSTSFRHSWLSYKIGRVTRTIKLSDLFVHCANFHCHLKGGCRRTKLLSVYVACERFFFKFLARFASSSFIPFGVKIIRWLMTLLLYEFSVVFCLGFSG